LLSDGPEVVLLRPDGLNAAFELDWAEWQGGGA